MGFSERLVGILMRPGQTFKAIVKEHVSLAEPFFIVLLASLCQGVYAALTNFAVLGKLGFPQDVFAFSPLALVGFSVVAGLAAWPATSVIIYALSRLLKGKGKLSSTLIVVGYAHLPLIFTICAGILVLFLPLQLFYLSVAIQIVFALWSVALLILGVREAHMFSTLRAFAAFILSAVVLFIIVVAVIVIAVIVFVIMTLGL